MCGIFACLNSTKTCKENSFHESDSNTDALLRNRGPDLFSCHTVTNENYSLTFKGNVLWQQGKEPCQQPLVIDEHILLFNGDIYMDSDGPFQHENDTKWLMNRIQCCQNESEFLNLFQNICGPFSIIYYNSKARCLYFIRDSLGRQSLLLGKNENCFILSSVVGSQMNLGNWLELPPLGIFRMCLNSMNITLNPWQTSLDKTFDYYTEHLETLERLCGEKIVIGTAIEPHWLKKITDAKLEYSFETILHDKIDLNPEEIFKTLLKHKIICGICDSLISCLSNSIKERVEATPACCKNCIQLQRTTDRCLNCPHTKIGILFSGGIDCTILALLANQFIPENNPIDLLNVSFEKVARTPLKDCQKIDYDSPDRISARQTLVELQRLCPKRHWNLVEIDVKRSERDSVKLRIAELMFPLKTVLDDSLGTALWYAASGNGVINGHNYQSPCRVVLIGSGADELFGGYTRHRNAFLRNPNSPWQSLENELNFDWIRLPSRNLARDDRVIGDNGVTARAPYVCESLTMLVRSLNVDQKCYFKLEQGVGDKLLLRLCAYKLGLRNVCSLKKRALQFGSRIADSKQNAKDIAIDFST